MKAICFNFEIHQPFRLKRYRFFDIGKDHYYFDDFLNDDIVTRVAHNSYIPACESLLRMIEQSEGRFRCSLAVSGVALEQFEHYVPELIELLKKLADTGAVEFVAQPFSYGLASLADPEEFALQIADTCHILRSRFGVEPKVVRNTELIYDDDLAPQLVALGFKGVLTEGAKHILGWKSPDYVYTAASAPKLKLLLRNSKLSDDIAYRFSDTSWHEFPLTADKYMDWIASTPADEQIVNIFLNMETFGDLHPATTGIFQFLEALPRMAAERGIDFLTPSQAISKLKPVGELSILHPISSADEARDTSVWLGNRLQHEAFEKLYSQAERIRECDNRAIKRDFQYLQSCDHFFYMNTRRPAAFSPYETPFAAFTNYMNVLADFLMRVEEEFPSQVGNEELNSLLLTIRNQGAEIETLNKELASMRKSVEQYNIEHRKREEAAVPAKTRKTSARKTASKEGAAKKSTTKKTSKKAADKAE
ncbi:MAG: glycoside hydrolase family 57 protein [Muribaculaceae bacterium]|nr:glycoside hydrolase family 57 protein [Muribaculaceae bacterium]